MSQQQKLHQVRYQVTPSTTTTINCKPKLPKCSGFIFHLRSVKHTCIVGVGVPFFMCAVVIQMMSQRTALFLQCSTTQYTRYWDTTSPQSHGETRPRWRAVVDGQCYRCFFFCGCLLFCGVLLQLLLSRMLLPWVLPAAAAAAATGTEGTEGAGAEANKS